MKMFQSSAARWFGILYISVSFVTNGSSQSQPGSVKAFTGEVVILPCQMKPIPNLIVEWTRSDQTSGKVHLYKDGQDSDGDQLQMYKGRTSLFKNELIYGNVSLKLSKVTLEDTADYKCRVPTEQGTEKSIKLQVARAKDELERLNKELVNVTKTYERYKAKNEQLSTYYVDKNRAELIQSVTKVMPITDLLLQMKLIQQEDCDEIKAARSRQDQMTQLYKALDKGGKMAKSAFFMILQEQEPDKINLDAGSTWNRGQITGVIIAVIVALLAASAVFNGV